MPKDNGGWRSVGTPSTARCPKCTNDRTTLIETYIYGAVHHRFFCKVCAQLWAEQERDDDEGDSSR